MKALAIIAGLVLVIGGAYAFGATSTQAGQAGGAYLGALITYAIFFGQKKTPRP